MKLKQATALFYQAMKADGLSDNTDRWYRLRLKILDPLGARDVKTITADDLRAKLIEVANENELYGGHDYRPIEHHKRSPFTIRMYTRAVKRLFNWLVEEGYIDRSPAEGIKPPPPPQRIPKAINEEDVRAMRQVAQSDPRNAALLAVFCSTGCRAAGVTGLRWSDIDLAAGEVTVIEKGNKQRIVFLDDEARAALARLQVANLPAPTDYVFTDTKGNSLRPDSLWHVLKKIAKRAGVKRRCNPHSFRHAFARDYLINGGDLKSLSVIMGHSSIKVTADTYSNYSHRDLKEKFHRHADLNQKTAAENQNAISASTLTAFYSGNPSRQKKGSPTDGS